MHFFRWSNVLVGFLLANEMACSNLPSEESGVDFSQNKAGPSVEKIQLSEEDLSKISVHQASLVKNYANAVQKENQIEIMPGSAEYDALVALISTSSGNEFLKDAHSATLCVSLLVGGIVVYFVLSPVIGVFASSAALLFCPSDASAQPPPTKKPKPSAPRKR